MEGPLAQKPKGFLVVVYAGASVLAGWIRQGRMRNRSRDFIE